MKVIPAIDLRRGACALALGTATDREPASLADPLAAAIRSDRLSRFVVDGKRRARRESHGVEAHAQALRIRRAQPD